MSVVYWLAGVLGVVAIAAVARAARRRRRFDRAARASIGQARYTYKDEHRGERPDLRQQAEARRADGERIRRHANRIDTGDAARRLEAVAERKRA